ncbi:hypothetical protein B0H63DRAFT_458621, partial [Podospora didyma]
MDMARRCFGLAAALLLSVSLLEAGFSFSFIFFYNIGETKTSKKLAILCSCLLTVLDSGQVGMYL